MFLTLELINLHLATRDYVPDAHPERALDSTCVHETAANIMAKANRDDALDTLVRISLRYVREDRNSI
jgi:hypothetical protein